MDPFSIASAASLGIGGLSALFGPDIDEENERITGRNRQLIQERMNAMQRIFGQRSEFYGEQMDIFNPQLAFAGTQGRQAASAGARAAQAQLRRQLGDAGGVFSAALMSGAQTAATDRQNTLRSLASAEAMKAAMREQQARTSLLSSMPIATFQPFMGAKNAQITNMFTNMGTGLGYLARGGDKEKGGDVSGQGPQGIPLAPGTPGAPAPAPIGPRNYDGSF